MSKSLTIGLFGFGCVGQGLWKILEQQPHAGVSIKKICVKNRNKPRPLPESYFTYNPEDILSDSEIDVVVELIDDATTAFSIVKRALEQGKHVVTANKKMLAENLEAIVRLQQEHNRAVLYEAAVCGSIPVIRTLEEYYAHQEITALEGIFNGSTNYILTRVIDEKLTYTEALSEAQAAGFAESDPTLDVEGLDPRNKLSIAILHAFGLFVPPALIPVGGINRVSAEEVEYARRNQLALKLGVHAQKTGNHLLAYVLPQFVPANGSLANVRFEFNAVQVTGSYSGKQLLIGKGAGSLPTALAVVSDIAAVAKNYRYRYPKQAQASAGFTVNVPVTAWVRFPEASAITWQVFRKIHGGHANASGQVIIGELLLDDVPRLQQENASVVVFADDCSISAVTAGAGQTLQQVA